MKSANVAAISSRVILMSWISSTRAISCSSIVSPPFVVVTRRGVKGLRRGAERSLYPRSKMERKGGDKGERSEP